MRRYGWDLSISAEQPIDSHLGRSHGIFHRKNDVVWNFDELTDEREIPRA
jgi:hypothetical protein